MNVFRAAAVFFFLLLLSAEAQFVLSNEVQMMQVEYIHDFGQSGDPSDDFYWYTLDFRTSTNVVSVRMQTPGGLDVSSTNAIADADGDDQKNWIERIMGTSPTNAASVLKLSNPWNVASGQVVQWESVTGRVYSIEWTDHLTNAFQSLEAELMHPQNSYTDTVHAAAGFYHLNVEME